ncbi:CAAD domain-containing protein [Phormidium sp. LEGE 05292]|uniref:CAAD domain-containing protein n=1 Tax=[Phormidium] sp. LEGE 05292 TaxID=767427 RepID=UPI00187FB556|nr:CAAD domain-containing protein [Phormidium sp. LEGE 05292]MBE9226480.1 CAAD domain-containing protein [Phormidium sp. LEGE 05292]
METKEPQQQTTPTVEVTVDQGGPIITNTPGSTSAGQVQEYWDIFVSYLAKLPDYLGDFFSTYQKPLITVGLIVGAFVTVKVTLAVLDALDDIPLLSPFFELVGIGYSGWFVYRYLLRASNRKELADEINGLKNQVVGGNKTPKV